jgi:hypothetical protein
MVQGKESAEGIDKAKMHDDQVGERLYSTLISAKTRATHCAYLT